MAVKNYGDASGYCEHGTYVGGCGIDWICGWCEDGIGIDEVIAMNKAAAIRRDRERVHTIRGLAETLRESGKTDDEVAQMIADFFHIF